MKKIIDYTIKTITILVLVDLLILSFSLLQVGLEGRTGEWSDFWRVQADFLMTVFNVR